MDQCGTCWVDNEAEASAVELVFTNERIVLQYIPSIDIAGRRWDQAMERIRKVLPNLTDDEWEQFDEPVIEHDHGHVCGNIEWYLMNYTPRNDWIVEARHLSPPLVQQMSRFLASADGVTA